MSGAFTVETPHSPLGPSSAEKWLNCPGSVLLTQSMKDPESWFAAEGTAAHTLSEWVRQQNRPAHEYIGRTLKVGGFEFTVDDEMAGGVHEFVSLVEQIPGVPLYEARVHYDKWVPQGFGTMDDGRLGDDHVTITDLKYGTGIQVFAPGNPQLRLYAAGCYQDFGWLMPKVSRFVLVISQPRLGHYDETEIVLKDLIEWMNDEVKPIAARAMLPGAPLKAGSHCQFCAAKRVCKVRADYVLKTVSGEFGDLDMPHNLAVLTNDDIAKILPHLANVKKWCGDIASHALGQIAKGEKVGDWKVVEGRSNRAWAASMEVIAAKLEPIIGDKLWAPREMRPITQVETYLGGKNKKTAAILADLVHKPQGKPKLAPGSDPKPAIAVDVTTEFSNLEEDE